MSRGLNSSHIPIFNLPRASESELHKVHRGDRTLPHETNQKQSLDVLTIIPEVWSNSLLFATRHSHKYSLLKGTQTSDFRQIKYPNDFKIDNV